MKSKEVKPNPWPINGYAPGNYQCTCGNCKTEFIGDKRAVVCLECAVSAMLEYIDGLRDEWKGILAEYNAHNLKILTECDKQSFTLQNIGTDGNRNS